MGRTATHLPRPTFNPIGETMTTFTIPRLLINSAVMPAPGRYTLRRMSRDEFVRELRTEPFISYIG